MRIDRVRETKHKQPFQPFTIHMADGRSFYIPHPDFLAIPQSARTVMVIDTTDHYNILDATLITELELHDPDEQAA